MKYIKYIVILLLIFFSIFLYVGRPEEKLISENISKNEIITIGVANTGAPYLYKSRADEQIGYNVDVLGLLSEKLNINFVLIEGSIEDLMKKLQNQQLDLILGLQYNASETDQVHYSKPFIDNHARIFVKSTTTFINSFEELAGKKVAIYKSDPSLSYVTGLKNIRIFKTESTEDAATMLKYGTVDAWIGNERESVLLLQNPNYSSSIKLVGEGIETFPSAIAAHRDNNVLIELINKGIEEISNSDELNAIETKWFGEIFITDNSGLKNSLYVALIVSVSLTIIITVIFRINHILKQEVDKRTKEIAFQKKLSVDMLQSLSDAVITIDGKKNILFVNEKVHELFPKQDIESCIGKKIEESILLSIISLEDIEKCIYNQETISNIEKRTKTNETKIFEYSINPIELSLSSGETINGATIVLRDQTEETIMKERMMSIDKLQSIGRMTADVAHELRNPLTSISTYIKILPQKYDNESFRDIMIQDLTSEIDRINVIVNNLLNQSKAKSPEREHFSLSKEISSILRLTKMQTQNEDITYVQQVDNRLLIEFDKNQFTQVCVNILYNAIEKLRVESGGQVRIVGKYHQNKIILSFEDSGSIIPTSDLESIFEPFYTTKDDGNGLGLSIVYELVSKNNGSVRAYNSELNKAVFELTLNGALIYD